MSQLEMRHYCAFVESAGDFLALLSYADACDRGELPGCTQDLDAGVPAWVPKHRFHYAVAGWTCELFDQLNLYMTQVLERTLEKAFGVHPSLAVGETNCTDERERLAHLFVYEMLGVGVSLSDDDKAWHPEPVNAWLRGRYQETPDFISVVPEWQKLMTEHNKTKESE